MKLIFVNRVAASRTLKLSALFWAVFSTLCIGLSFGLIVFGYEMGRYWNAEQPQELRLSEAELEASRRAKDLVQLSVDARRKLEAMTRKLAELQARVTRLDALGTYLTSLAGLDEGEFDFISEPALGGLFRSADDVLTAVDSDSKVVSRAAHDTVMPDEIHEHFELLSVLLDDRDTQLDVLSGLLFDADTRAESIPSGRPVTSGWLSSNYGYRHDPFNGRKAWHQGVDFAGKKGDAIIAVASGLVSWSGERSGYGITVEVAHGDGLITRYAHSENALVKVGDLVRKGETIATMGSTGRSTGPHVHFEVLKYGRLVDPSSYIHRTLH